MKLQEIYGQYESGKLDKFKYIDAMYEKHKILFDYQEYLKGTDIESITISNDSVYATIKWDNIKMLLDKHDKRFIPIEIMNFGSMDPKERRLLSKLTPHGATVFDIGANIGWYALNFAKMPKVKKVYAFEPVPYTYDYLIKHIKLNGLKNVSAFNFGFSDKPGQLSFYWTKDETGSSSIKNIRKRSKINKIKCKLTTIDKFAQDHHASVDLIKCDVEGSELFVFKGAISTLKKNKPIIYTEMLRKWSKEFNYHPNDIINLLSGLGYYCYGYIGNKIKKIDCVTDELETTNFFFFHKTNHKNIIKTL